MSKSYFFVGKIAEVEPKGGDNKREAWMPNTGLGYFDNSARRYFETKRQKRAWLASNKMRETGELFQKKLSKRDPQRIIEGTGGAINRFKAGGK